MLSSVALNCQEQRLHPPFFGSDYLSQVWVKSHLSESNLSKKGPPKCAYSRHILFCDKSAMLFHKSMEKKNSDNPFLTLSCSYLFHSMKGLITVSRAFVFQNEGIQPFLSQINTFGKWLRLSAKSLLSKPEKTQISEQTQIIWVRWSLCTQINFSLVPPESAFKPNLC